MEKIMEKIMEKMQEHLNFLQGKLKDYQEQQEKAVEDVIQKLGDYKTNSRYFAEHGNDMMKKVVMYAQEVKMIHREIEILEWAIYQVTA